MSDMVTSSPTDDYGGGNATRTLVSVAPAVRTSAASQRSSPWRWLALIAILLAGNIANALSWRFAVPIDTGAFSIALAVGLYITPGWSLWRQSRSQVLAWRPRWRHVVIAVGAGLALALPSVLFFAVASARGGVGYTAIPALPIPSLVIREMVEIPILTAVIEELIFRHFAFRMIPRWGMTATVLSNAGIFTLWHLVVTARTVLATHFAVSPLLLAGAYVSSLATIFVAGVVFALVRWRTGSFAYSALTHWLVLGIITLAVWVL
jgi:membrane protease YdiL (CAAX protease family)